MNWEEIDWEILERLRRGFLAAERNRRPYWQSEADLANYDFTFGARIGWKWDAVAGELKRQAWGLPEGVVLDWGCGSGVASRRVLALLGGPSMPALRVHDRSPRAMEFAAAAARREFPDVDVAGAGAELITGAAPIGTLVVSHVLNEMPAGERKALVRLARRATAVLWVEPGTHEDSRSLVAVREMLREEFRVVAPCPHCGPCGLLAAGQEQHWCHFFAPPPPGLFMDSGWVTFARRAGIDLRSLPYSFLVLDRREPGAGEYRPAGERMLGLPRMYKGFAKVFRCRAEGVGEVTIQERGAPEVFEALREGRWPKAESG